MGNKPRDDLYYFQWEVSDAKTLQKMLDAGKITLAQVGELFLAVMDYVNQEEVEVSPELLFIYTAFQTRIDSKREARVKVGMARAESGRKGGQAKAESAKAESARKTETTFTPPTKKQFLDAIEHFADEGAISEPDDYEIDEFYDELKDSGWRIGGAPIRRRSDWEEAIVAKFNEIDKPPLPRALPYRIFERVYSDFQGVRDQKGRSMADEITFNFLDTFREDSKTWPGQGRGRAWNEWPAALVAFMREYPENMEAWQT